MMKSAATLACALASGALLSGCVSTDCGPEPSPTVWQSAAFVSQATADNQQSEAKIAKGVPKAYWNDVNRTIVEAVNYPKQATDHFCEGTATIRVWIKPDGTVARVELINPAGAGILDTEALAVMQRIGQLPPVPDASPSVDYYVFESPISFFLRHR